MARVALDGEARVLAEHVVDVPPPQRLRTRRLDERAAAAAQREQVLRVERRGDQQLQVERQIANRKTFLKVRLAHHDLWYKGCHGGELKQARWAAIAAHL